MSKMILNNGRTIDLEFFHHFKSVITKRIPTLQVGVSYTVKQICKTDFWSALLPGDQKATGWCMTHLVSKQEIPMVSVGKNSSNSNLYQRV